MHPHLDFLVTMLSATDLSSTKMYLLSSKRLFRSQESTMRYSNFFLIPVIQYFVLKHLLCLISLTLN